jgi:hypothetical protein
MCACGRAGAESFTYQGQIQIQSTPGDPCAATSSEASYTISVYGRDDSLTQRIDGYLDGDKIVHAHVTGNNLDPRAPFAHPLLLGAVHSHGQLAVSHASARLAVLRRRRARIVPDGIKHAR